MVIQPVSSAATASSPDTATARRNHLFSIQCRRFHIAKPYTSASSSSAEPAPTITL